jgi:phosphonatase-like hydrolase
MAVLLLNTKNMTPIKLVVFDIAGTTVKDAGNIKEAFASACADFNISIPDDAINKVMGWRKIDAIKMLLQQYHPSVLENNADLIEQIHKNFTSRMVDFYNNDETLVPLPHAVNTFAALRQQGIKVALNTGFSKIITTAILKKLQWEETVIDAVISSDEVPEGRPHAFMIKALMQQFNINNPAAVAKVGDTEVDVLEGRNSECGKVISVTTGAYTRQELVPYSPDYIIDSLETVASLILEA